MINRISSCKVCGRRTYNNVHVCFECQEKRREAAELKETISAAIDEMFDREAKRKEAKN